MDVRFDPVQWQPSKPQEPGDAVLSGAYKSYLCDKLCERSKAILHHPYDPVLWLRRSSTLSRLRYPELAVGDAYKAKMLCQTHLAQLTDSSGWYMGHRMGFWMRDEPAEANDRVETLTNYLKTLLECADHHIGEHTETFVENPQVSPKVRGSTRVDDHECC